MFWDILSNIHKFFNNGSSVQPPYNSNNKLNFGVTLDIAKDMPKNPNSYNGYMEKANQVTETGRSNLEQGFETVVSKTVGVPLGALDKKTSGNVSKALMAGTLNFRKNYAFSNDLYRKNASLGLLSTLGMVGSGVLGAAAGVAVGTIGGPAGMVAGGYAGARVGSGLGGTLQRKLAKEGTFDYIDKDIKEFAKFSETAVGQEKYNFGRDVTKIASHVTTWNTLGDTTKGFGSTMSGVINIVAELTLAPDIAAGRLLGVTTKGIAGRGVQAKLSGPVERSIAKFTNEEGRQYTRTIELIDLHKKTAAGEKTSLTPVYEFIQNSDAITIQQYSPFKGNEYGNIGAPLIAGKDFYTQSLVSRVGLGDKSAIKELEIKAPAISAQIARHESAVEFIVENGTSKGVLKLSGKNELKKDMLEKELKDLRSEKKWLDETLEYKDALPTLYGVSPIASIERIKFAAAEKRVKTKYKDETGYKLLTPEGVTQKHFMQSKLSAVVRFIDRGIDDAPHQTINYNDALQSNTRVRTTLRMGVVKKIFTPEESVKLANDFAIAGNEGIKNLIVDEITQKAITNLAKKYNLPENLKDDIVAQHAKMTRKNIALAKDAKAANKQYFVDEISGEIIHDPVLISQLANGGYLPDIKLIDKAMAGYEKRKGAEAGIPQKTGHNVNYLLDEFQSIWRTFTLLRVGFPINIMRDSTVRSFGDGVLFGMVKHNAESFFDVISNSGNTVKKIKRITEARINPDKNLKKINKEIVNDEITIAASRKILEEAGYNPKKPIKNPEPELLRTLDYIKAAEIHLNMKRAVRDAIESKIPSPVVSRKTLTFKGVEGFERYDGGVQGQIMLEKIQGTDIMRGLVSSSRELGVSNISRDRTSGKTIVARETEELHLKAWETSLTNQLSQDIVARKIMEGKMSKKEVISWIASHESGQYLERFGFVKKKERNLNRGDAAYVYGRVLDVVNALAPDEALRKAILAGTVTRKLLKELYPDLNKRPNVTSDLTSDMLGQSALNKGMLFIAKDAVRWMATQPTARLSYSPYFNVKYQEKLQNAVAMATAQGRILDATDKIRFQSIARSHALNEMRSKINVFSRDMNYHSLINYIFAFFPAIVEQFRSYGRIMLDHPEFPLKISAVSTIPDYLQEIKIDAYGEEYFELELPLLDGIKGRVKTDWFNVINPTGGSSIISPGPIGATAANFWAKKWSIPGGTEGKLKSWLLPFGTSQNNLMPFLPTTIRRLGEVFNAWIFDGGGEQFNKDVYMFMKKAHFDFIEENGREPHGQELSNLAPPAQDNAVALAFARLMGSALLPAQLKYGTPLMVYGDLYAEYRKKYGEEADERFTDDYPEYYMLTDSLSDSTSGVRNTDTAVALVKKNKKAISDIIGFIGEKGNLSSLGAIFNDENYAFSDVAQTYLISHKIPGTDKMFKDQGAALDTTRSTIVNKGWAEYTQMTEIITNTLLENNIDPDQGYGLSILNNYKQSFTNDMSTKNNLWYEEKQGSGFENKLKDTISALTIAANSPDLWKDLSKQNRWYTIVEYLNFRYDVHDLLKAQKTSYKADKAIYIRVAAEKKIAELRRKDIEFGKFYDRYFSNDDFSYIMQDPFGGK